MTVICPTDITRTAKDISYVIQYSAVFIFASAQLFFVTRNAVCNLIRRNPACCAIFISNDTFTELRQCSGITERLNSAWNPRSFVYRAYFATLQKYAVGQYWISERQTPLIRTTVERHSTWLSDTICTVFWVVQPLLHLQSYHLRIRRSYDQYLFKSVTVRTTVKFQFELM